MRVCVCVWMIVYGCVSMFASSRKFYPDCVWNSHLKDVFKKLTITKWLTQGFTVNGMNFLPIIERLRMYGITRLLLLHWLDQTQSHFFSRAYFNSKKSFSWPSCQNQDLKKSA